MSILKALKEPKNTVAPGVIKMCDLARRLEDSGEYAEAAEALGNWWQDIGVRPDVDNLSDEEKAAILSRVGTLSGWLGSMKQVSGAQEKAKDLISEGANLFERIQDHDNWADARSDLAICYWREGAFDEARVVLQDVVGGGLVVSPELKGKILLRLVTVETSTKHFETASSLLNQVDSLIKDKGNPLLLGKFYFYRAFTLHCQGEDQNKRELLLSSADDYRRAGLYYKKANHGLFAANVENNLGNVYRLLNDYKNAHSHLNKAIYLYIKLKDQSNAALVYENKAQALLAENKLEEAETAVRTSVAMMRTGDEKSILAESLTTLGIVLSRGGKVKEAELSFVEAKETALEVGDNESAGNAVLTYIEELKSILTPLEFSSLYLEADELLQDSPKISTINRLKKIARKQVEIGRSEVELEISWENFNLPEAVRTHEGKIIMKALNETSGRVTKAAQLLGLSHQNLSLILHQRHKELQQFRVQRKSRRDTKAKTH